MPREAPAATTDTLPSWLAVALVALPRLRLRLLASVGGQRAAHIIGFLELAFSIAPDIALVCAGVD